METDVGDRYHAEVRYANDVNAFQPRIVRKPVQSSADSHGSWTSSTGNDGQHFGRVIDVRYDEVYPSTSHIPLSSSSLASVAHKQPRDDEDTVNLLASNQTWRGQHDTMTASTDSSVLELIGQCSLHLLPTLITALLLALNWRNVYWEDVDATKRQAMVLQALQFPIKGHEILMVASIAAIVLHRVRYDLLVRKDLPLGFLTSPYRIGEIRYLFSYEFRGALKRTNLRQLSMALLVILGTVSTLVVGPSSGVLMIPKLNWWNIPYPFGTDTESIYFYSTPSQKWPTVLPEYSCGSWGCPNSDTSTLGVWCMNLRRQHVTPQITFFGGSSFHRTVTSNSTTYNDGWTVATTLLMRDAEAISSFWNYVVQFDRAPAFLRRPRLSPQYVSGESFQKPLVQVQCSAPKEGKATDYPHSGLKGTRPGMYDGVKWSIPSNVSSWVPKSNTPTFNFTSIHGLDNAPTLVGIFHVQRADDKKAIAVPCSILTHWIPTTIWIDPKADMNSHDSYENPLQAFDPSTDRSKWVQFAISDGWLNQTGTASLEGILGGMTEGEDYAGMLKEGFEGLSWRLSTILGMWLTDNIARFAPDHAVMLHHERPGSDSETFRDIGILKDGSQGPAPPYTTWEQYIEENALERIAVEVDRYGYAWSFRGSLIKAAAALLVVHSLLALTHLLIVFHSRWTSTAWSSVGSIVAFALRSDADQLVKASSYLGADPDEDDKRKRRMWTVPVGAAREETGTGSGDLKLVVGRGLDKVGPGDGRVSVIRGDIKLVPMR